MPSPQVPDRCHHFSHKSYFATWFRWSSDDRLDNALVDEKRFSNVFDFGNRAFEVECFGEDDFEDLRICSNQEKMGL